MTLALAARLLRALGFEATTTKPVVSNHQCWRLQPGVTLQEFSHWGRKLSNQRTFLTDRVVPTPQRQAGSRAQPSGPPPAKGFPPQGSAAVALATDNGLNKSRFKARSTPHAGPPRPPATLRPPDIPLWRKRRSLVRGGNQRTILGTAPSKGR